LIYWFIYLHINLGDNGDKDDTKILQQSAVFLANLFYLTSDTYSPIITLKSLVFKEETELKDKNVILLGTESCTNQMEICKPIRVAKESVSVGN